MRWFVLAAAVLVGACAAQSGIDAGLWYDGVKRIAPSDANRVWVCHGFGCHYKTVYAFSPSEIAAMRRIMGRPSTPAAERRRIKRLIAWAEKRVAPSVGSADDVAGLDLGNARKRGQMDCIDEATNTTSYLLLAQANGMLRHHEVARPVARGFFLDGRYPHATAVIQSKTDAYAVDSWPISNGEPPEVMPLEAWFAKSPATEE